MLKFFSLFWLVSQSAAFNVDLSTLLVRQTAAPNQLPDGVLPALAFERSTWVKGSVSEDPFYQVAPGWADADFGTVFRVEDMDPTLYTIPPTTSISRILYQSKSFLGKKTPASGYVLFPYSPRKIKGGSVPVVVWGHGTSGLHPESGPSHLRDLWQNAQGPTPLVQQGYVVVAPDYAGLGVGKNAAGKNITHEYLTGPAQANDMEYALKAARSAFSFLGKQFTTIGHSQGGGAVWSFAERMRTNPIDGYLGGVAISPVTRLLDLPQGNPIKALLVAATLPTIANIYPDFNISSVLTPEGAQRFALEQKTGGNVQATIALLLTMAGFPILKDGWEKNEYIQRFQAATGNGGKPIKGPLLVIQGDNDFNIDVRTTTAAVEKTATANPKESISYAIYSNITHASAVWVGQQRYLDWIARRFDGEAASTGFSRDQVSSLRPWAKYQAEQNFYAARATEFYQVPA
ncbi:alpha/beta-hydrolase [Karstenula rhodostoma CBS 690.94]|uniref:Alpha/beta-hydrolase n=1 Tax=Karstenula rhodostoma CBS 690.94 TaxID=1392251 RepID=A0A9P4P6S6_9PLEO|nr:alpha/beta-hydrolase [Karstenula rhodostoma CBS 690.94]